MAAESSSKIAVVAALIGNLLVAITKGIAAALTGSSSMLSEAVHSLVDTVNEVLLLYGMRRAAQRADAYHPFGYGRELYFWSFVVALLIFALGAGVSIFEGIGHVRQPEPVTDPYINYIVLGLAFLFEGGSWLVSLRQFRAAKGDLGYFEAFRRSKDPPSFMVLFEDSAALIGIVLAALGTYGSASLGLPVLDGVASILIGVVLAVTSMLLARESKSLLVGERADRGLADAIVRIAATAPGVEVANGVVTTQMGPNQIVAALSIDFADAVSARDVEAIIEEIERKVRAQWPEVISLFVKPQSRAAYEAALSRHYGAAS
ncbi:MAG TPA: cation diffusion facilitator family transporter [Casimicrobiaceae bacterium]|jgi:cation diffusion facilitator family transporter|nr:cation diffusion facilitator family transporter [Casimicrobiaceae bacterium]